MTQERIKIDPGLLVAMRALNMYTQVLSTSSIVNMTPARSIFDKQILPILTYGCVLWGSNKQTNYLTITSKLKWDTHRVRQLVDQSCKKLIKLDWLKDITEKNKYRG